MTATLPQLWLLDLRAYQETSRWRTLLPGLPPERQRRALACRWEIDGARLACAGFLLQQTLASAGIPISDQVFTKNEWGKPRLVSNAVDFSLSHAGNFCVCALDSSPLGVDVELPRISMAAFIRTKRLFCRRCPKKRRKTRCFASGPRRKAISSISGAGCASRSIRSASVSMKTAPACRRPARLPPFACTNTRTTAVASACAPKAPARRFNSINRNKAAAG